MSLNYLLQPNLNRSDLSLTYLLVEHLSFRCSPKIALIPASHYIARHPCFRNKNG